MVVTGKLVQVRVDGLARDIPVCRDAFSAHGIEGVLEQPVLDLGEQAGVDLPGAPDSTD
jgi:hypothetical protein